jgi:hypothetical protein
VVVRTLPDGEGVMSLDLATCTARIKESEV